MAKNYAQMLIENFNDYMAPPGQIRQDVLQRVKAIQANLASGSAQEGEFNNFVRFLNTQRENIPGEVNDILDKMHPYTLAQIAMKFRHFQTATGGDLAHAQNF